MQKKVINHIFFCSVILLFFNCRATIYDNRYFPLFGESHIYYDTTQSKILGRFSAATANEAFRAHGDDPLSLPDLQGNLDLNVVGNALTLVGKTNPLPTAWQGREILWKAHGKIQMQSLFFEWDQHIYGPLSTGFSGGFMKVHGYNSYRYDRSNLVLGPGDPLQMEESREQLFDLLGVNGGAVSHTAFSDIDWYLRLGKRFEYALKLREINIGGRIGLLLPSGRGIDNNAAASVPFGGDMHWGIYGAFDGMFEVKEDMKAGFLLRIQKRFVRTLIRRMPVLKEPQYLGAVVGNVHINPGMTYIVAPYVMLENIQKGLGVFLQYTLRVHTKDVWCDARQDKTVPVMLEPVEKRSSWSSDYFSLQLFYDFGKERIVRDCDPVVFFRWDFPYKALATEQIAKTHQLSCGIACAF